MVFGEPVTGVSEALGVPREINGLAQRVGRGETGAHRREIENGERDHAQAMRSSTAS
jgi:hypothetical protein